MTKKTVILTLLIGQTFLWTGSAFMSVLYRLYGFYDQTSAVIITECLYYIMQAAGIAVFALILKYKPVQAGSRIFSALCIAAAGLFTILALLSGSGAVVLTAGLLMNTFVGMLSGIYLTRLSSCIPQQCRGKVFGYSYAIGSIGTWLLSMPMHGTFLQSGAALYVFLGLIIMSVVLVRYLEPLDTGNENALWAAEFKFDKKLLVLALLIPLICSIVNGMGGYFSAADLSEVLNPAFTRAFYAVGLIAAGYINDKNRRYGAVCCVVALVFPFLSLAMKNEVDVSIFLSIISYIFYGFFSVYRVVLFADLAGKRSQLLYMAVFGLMSGRVGDALGTLSGVLLGSGQVMLTLITAAVFIAGMLLFFALYHRLYMPLLSEKENTEALLNEFEARYEFTLRQCDIFRLVVKGCSNAEISTELFLSESTVKFHMKNILKKTECTNRTELIAKYKVMQRAG